jgi:acyl-CoA dehydrogenase
MSTLNFPLAEFPESAKTLRAEVRAFLADELAKGTFRPRSDFGAADDASFSRKMGARGWLGMTWPKKYGGHERSMLERYVVTEEMLAAGAPCGAHWTADRQSGPNILRYGTEEQKMFFCPKISKGELFFSIGMSEPDSGSDLASVRSRAEKVDGGWKLTGRKVWTSGAHRNHYAITMVRTTPLDANKRHEGLSQFLLDLKSPGITILPIRNMAGDHHFNEVVLDGVFVPDNRILGKPGDGWKQVTSELAYERAGPERFLSTLSLFKSYAGSTDSKSGNKPDDRKAEQVGRYLAHYMTLRGMSTSIAGMLDAGQLPNTEAAIVKDLGATLEREMPEKLRLAPGRTPGGAYEQDLQDAVINSVSWTLRGGTPQILKGIIAKGLGLR